MIGMEIESTLENVSKRYLKREAELRHQITCLKMEIDTLKEENDRIWKIYVEKVADMKVKARLGEEIS